MLSKITKGDEVLTAGGIYGKVKKVSEEEVTVEISKEVEIKVSRSTIKKIVEKEVKSKKA